MCYSALTPPKEAGRLVRQHKADPKQSPCNTKETVMTIHSSATAQRETPHETETTIITVSDATKCRAESVIKNKTIDPEWRTIIRAALELNDPWLADIVNRA